MFIRLGLDPRQKVLRDPITLTTAVVAAAGAGAQVHNQRQAEKSAKSLAADQDRARKQELANLQASQNEAILAEDKTRTRDEARRRQKQAAAGAFGRRSTILTSPLGDLGSATDTNYQRKTLIGA